MTTRAMWRPAVVAITYLLGACVDDTRTPVEPQGALAIQESANVYAPAGSIDAVFLEVNRTIPGFAGMIRENGRDGLLLVDESRAGAARQAIAARLPNRAFGQLTTRKALYEWQDLATW